MLAVFGVGGAWLWANRHAELPAIAPLAPSSFARALVDKGEVLAAVGNCVVCHTAPGGEPLAGGTQLQQQNV